MGTLALDPDTWDIFTDSSSCLAVANGCDEIMQCIKQNILALDLSRFFPLRNADVEGFSSIIQATIAGTDGVISFNSFQLLNDDLGCGVVSGLRIQFSALTVCGTISGGI